MSIKLVFASTAALAMVAATPAFAARSQNQNPQVALPESGGGDAAQAPRKTCRTFQNTVSRVKATKLCLTRAEWKKFEAEQSE
ncbi:MAG: hypothetical protein QOJ91_1080 [Sphingomonadales bacterium]|jgi:hypothetical protein|nr:hypothetical protein [Sphingomonadales bacterium]